ncbi:hypothetical protein CTEN210_17685 [Chaetoceros tenuissimus]|uniref:Uncharacterized protein n=1 Tax=Chaetoceros tenuissimus TaxID=426638 RepID=A0AAD3DB54_9STRA|nr:hypothetical protein CTEN210_17685 [Chaetoceros tenuissimus]
MSRQHLTGRIEFRFNLGQGQPRDRQHKIDDSSSTSDGIQQNNIPHSKAGKKRPRDESQDVCNTDYFQDEAGFYFIQDGDMCQNQSFLIVAASPEMYLVTTASSSNSKVEIRDFELLTCNKVKTIHIYKDGIRCLIDEKVNSMKVDKKVRYLSLADVNKIEDSSDKNELKILKRKMSIEAMVDAISPIITVVKTDPFAIIEIYDDDGRSTVVILKGKHALQLHAYIEPGNKIMLKDVKRQKWHVPKSLEKEGIPKRLRSRSPEYVFVVSAVNQMSLEEAACPSKGTFPQCLPSTIHPLTSIQGEVMSVKFTSFMQSDCEVRQLHYILMKPCNLSNNDKDSGLMKLYMTYYPTSPSLFIGLKKGCIVRAINVHRCESDTLQTFKKSVGEEYRCFGACLRSTVSMAFMPAFDKHEALHTSLSQIQFSVFAFKTIRRTYYEMEWMSLFRMQFSRCKLILDHADKFLTTIQTRCNCYLHNHKKGRDPYFEFFDHGCECLNDEDREDSIELCFCPVKMPQLDFPFFLSIDEVRRIGIMRIKEAMPALYQTFTNKSFLDRKLGVGCTSSIHIRSDELSRQLGYCTGNICIAGALHSMKSNEVRTINDGDYILQCCKCSFQAETSFQSSRKEVQQIGDMINLNVHKVIISMIYLGEYGATGNDNGVVISDLKSPHSSSNGISFVVQQKNLFFLASLHLQYREAEPTHLNTNTQSINFEKTQSLDETKFARLVRQRWRPTRRKQVYNGYEVGLGNFVPFVDKKLNHDPYHHTMKLSIQLQSSAIDLPFLPPQVIAMADAWLGLVESSLSALLTGCWDELNENTENILYAIYLHFDPSDIVGKVIDLAQVNVKVIEYENTCENMKLFPVFFKTENGPSFLGGKPMVPGTVSNRVKRKHLVSKKIKIVFGEALIQSPLMGSNCSALSLSKLNFISSVGKVVPCYNSIKIRNAQVIKIRFCRAKAECNHCFSPLIRKKKTEHQSRFWSNPLSLENLTSKSKAKVGTKLPRLLVCPNKCDERHAYIKWELSGILHDNTGTAKIFSERDTTLLILGEGLDVQCIESGAWTSPYGITYKAGVQMIPKNAVDSNEKISVDSMAYLELYRHCTSCGTFQRPLDFICKIKSNPANEPNTQDSEEIPIVSSLGKEGTVMRSSDLSFTSKSMNLLALDACRTSNEPQISGWSILNNL